MIFEVDGTTTALSFAPAADGVSVLILGSGDAIGEVVSTGTTAGAPLDPAAPFATLHGRASSRRSMGSRLRRHRLRWWQEPPVSTTWTDGLIAIGDAAAAEACGSSSWTPP